MLTVKNLNVTAAGHVSKKIRIYINEENHYSRNRRSWWYGKGNLQRTRKNICDRVGRPQSYKNGVLINFSSVAAYTMPQTSEWTQAFEAWNKPDFYDQLLALAGEAEDEESEFFRTGLAYAMSKKFVIYFTQKNVSRFEFKKRSSLQIGDCFFFEDYSIA